MSRRTAIRWSIAVALLAGGVAVALFARSVLGRDAMQLQICMEVERPILAWPCKQALYRLHPTAAEIRELNRSAGAQFVVFMEDRAEAQRLLAHYLQVPQAGEQGSEQRQHHHLYDDQAGPLSSA